jgi:sulfide:quinone oxidoreductase
MTEKRTVLILGAGIGGIALATRLRRLLPRAHRITLVDQEATHVFAPSLLWLMTGDRTADQISRPLSALAGRGIEVVRGTVARIDPQAKAAWIDGQEFRAEHLVIALGAALAPERVPGLAEAGHNLYSLAGAEALRDARLAVDRGRIVVLIAAMPFKCPAAPNEAVMLLEYDCRKRGVRDGVQLDLYTPEPGPMAVAGPQVSQALRQMIEAKGIGYHPEHAVTAVDPAGRRIRFANGAETDFALLAYVPPHGAPKVVRDAGLCGESGWIPVDRETMRTRFPGVYALGDVAGIMLSSIGRPLPKAGVLAHNEAEVLAHNIACEITGRGAARRFTGDGSCFVETGDGRAGFGSGNFYADPAPQIRLRPPTRLLHWGKIAYEKYWLWRWL